MQVPICFTRFVAVFGMPNGDPFLPAVAGPAPIRPQNAQCEVCLPRRASSFTTLEENWPENAVPNHAKRCLQKEGCLPAVSWLMLNYIVIVNYLSICLSICLSIYLSIYLPTYQ